MSTNQDIAEKATSVGFKQNSFFIEKVVKNSLSESDLPEDCPLTLRANKTYSISTQEDDPLVVKMILGFVADMVLTTDDTLSFRFIEVSAQAIFRLESEIDDIASNELLQRMLLIQANVQLTDFVNTLVVTSELRGNKVPYDL